MRCDVNIPKAIDSTCVFVLMMELRLCTKTQVELAFSLHIVIKRLVDKSPVSSRNHNGFLMAFFTDSLGTMSHGSTVGE